MKKKCMNLKQKLQTLDNRNISRVKAEQKQSPEIRIEKVEIHDIKTIQKPESKSRRGMTQLKLKATKAHKIFIKCRWTNINRLEEGRNA